MESVIVPVFLMLLLVIKHTNTIQGNSYADVTPDVYQRAEILKQQIRDEIRQNQAAFIPGIIDPVDMDKSPEMANDYDIALPDNKPITPIMKFDERKDVRHRHKETTTITPETTSATMSFSVKPLRTNPKKNRQQFIRKRPAEIFYRRELDQTLNHPVHGIHCCDLLAPYLLGETGNGTFKIITMNNRIVLRILQLISEKTDTSTKDEIYSLLYQISTINIRLFQWDEKAMKLLFNQVVHSKVHSFRTLKRGIKELLQKWHMDFGNITNLLRQTRVFRPPCIQTSELAGSTKTSKAYRYTRSTTPKRTCNPEDDECD